MSAQTFDPATIRRTRVNALALLAAPAAGAAVLWAVAGPPALIPLLLGVAGWIVALLVRQPLILVATRLTSQQRAATIVGWFSGPAEELVRLALVLLALSSGLEAAWAGYGWAAVEVVFVAVNTLAIAAVLAKDDPKAREAQALLAAQGITEPPHLGWGVLERLSATALHLGFTLLLFAEPWLVVVTLPLHSVVNMLTVRYFRAHLAVTELALAVVAAAVLAAGVLLTR